MAGFFRGLVNRRPLTDVDSREAWLVVIGTVPIVILGLVLKKHIESTFRGLWVITTMVIVVAILMEVAERWAKLRRLRTFDEMNVGDAVTIGLGQCLALIPGSSRSGSTIMAALFRGIDRPTAARYSFLLAFPPSAAPASSSFSRSATTWRRSDGRRSSSRSSSPSFPATRRSGSCCAT